MQPRVLTHRSLEKALEILLAFLPHNAEMGTVELSKIVGFHRSTVNRLLHVLARYGFVEQNPDTRKFILGHSIVDLGSAVHQSLSGRLTRIAIPHIEKLRNKLGETVVLEVAGPTHTNIAHIAEGPGPIRLKETVGARHGYNAAAGAKSILAFSPEDFQERVLGQELTRFTSKTITNSKALNRHLKEIKRRGFSFDDEERNTEIRAFGCPVFDHDGVAVAAVVVAGPAHRITWERRFEIVPALKETAERISRDLYYEGGAKNREAPEVKNQEESGLKSSGRKRRKA
jgi:DNA-binding IclR family transcriptional regulator